MEPLRLDIETLAVTSFAVESSAPSFAAYPGDDPWCCTGCVSGCGINPTASGCASGGGSDNFDCPMEPIHVAE